VLLPGPRRARHRRLARPRGVRSVRSSRAKVQRSRSTTCALTAEADATLASLPNSGHSAHKVSVLDKAGLVELAKMLDAKHGKIDILVNNAGHGQVVPLALMEESDWDDMIDTHVKGAFLTTQAVLRAMVRERYGGVINVSSLAGVKMMQAPVHYATAKAALKGFTESLAKEVGRYGITINAIRARYPRRRRERVTCRRRAAKNTYATARSGAPARSKRPPRSSRSLPPSVARI